MCTPSEESFHYDYIRLAWDVGFTFEDLTAQQKLDLNVIASVDVDQVARDRDIPTVVKYIPTLLGFRFENDIGRVLEPNFIKLFKLAQLSIQYLKFCKTYLDNTVALLKNEVQTMEAEKKQLEVALHDVHQDNDNLNRKIQEIQATSLSSAAYKCQECTKTFYSEEYLFAHIKRRHEPIVVSQQQNESDKLQTEIKELKQRLNNTEKLISEKESEKELEHVEPNNDAAIFEKSIQYKFEQLKNHIETEITSLKNEEFYRGICEKFIQERSSKRLSMHTLQAPAINITGSSKIDKATQDDTLNIVNSTESGTQTEEFKNYISEGTSTIPLNCIQHEIKAVSESGDAKEKEAVAIRGFEEKLAREAELQRATLEQILDLKLSGSLNKMEAQMNAFWEKINAWESVVAKPMLSKSASNLSLNVSEQVAPPADRNSRIVPVRRPNSVATMNVGTGIPNNSAPKPLPRQRNRKPGPVLHSPITVAPKREKNPNTERENIISKQFAAFLSDSSTSDTETEETESSEKVIAQSDNDDDQPSNIKPSASFKKRLDEALLQRLKGATTSPPVLAAKETKPEEVPVIQVHYRREQQATDSESVDGSSLNSSNAGNGLQQIQEMKERLKQHVEKSMNEKLKQIGISPTWKGLPEKSYRKALDIIEHQASLTKRNVVDYHKIRKQIELRLEKSANESFSAKTNVTTTPKLTQLQDSSTKLSNELTYGKVHRKKVNFNLHRAEAHNDRIEQMKTDGRLKAIAKSVSDSDWEISEIT